MNQEQELKRAAKLLRRQFSYIGMIKEIEMKCNLLQSRAKQISSAGGDPAKELPDLADQVAQMRSDLSKYSRRMQRIREELDSYGIFRDMA